MQKQAFKRIMKESAPALIVAALIDIMAGTTMQLRGIEAWVAIPVFLMLVPPLSDLGNDVACILSSRITTLLALGVIKPKLESSEALETNIIAILTIGTLSSLYMGMITFAVADKAGLGSVPIFPFLAVCVISVIILTLLVCVAAIGIAFIAWRRGLDPDNVTIPISTSISDVLGIFSLLIAMGMVGFI
ncbi:MAG: magnesium transporter [Candidatus Bathyarchaeota archaeon]|nr:magnesium transporter [Candidatus Bathyarchaeota archaeon]